MKRLVGRIAVVSGAGSGIGRETALALARAGCRIAVVDIAEGRAQAVAEEIRAAGQAATAHVVDVARREDWDRLAGEIESEYGAAHILVNNAGVTVYGPFERMKPEQIDWLLDINLRGVLHGCHSFLPLLGRSDEAQIVNLSSMAAMIGLPNQTTYCASKAAVRGFSGGLRIECARKGIGVTVVLPGAIATSFMERAPSHDAETTAAMSRLMQRHAVSPEVVAGKIVQAIRRNRHEVIVGPDSKLTYWMMGLAPWIARLALRLIYGRYTGPDGKISRAPR